MKLLDLFCGGGGCSMGYYNAGFKITGVDIEPRKHYPFEFYQGDAMEILKDQEFLNQFDAIHASPPCYKYSRLNYIHKNEKHVDLVDEVRKALVNSKKIYVIENVVEAPMHGIVLCGSMFGLKVIRHRKFESNLFLLEPFHKTHNRQDRDFLTVTGNGGSFNLKTGSAAMGIEFYMNKKELANAIPPAYTEFIGEQIKNAIHQGAAQMAM